MTASEYSAMTAHTTKAEIKETKKLVCRRFEKFSGIFIVKYVASNSSATGRSKPSGTPSGSSGAGGSQSQGSTDLVVVKCLQLDASSPS